MIGYFACGKCPPGWVAAFADASCAREARVNRTDNEKQGIP